MKSKFKIANTWVGNDCPVYFIADIAANHDGDFSRAEALIYLAADAGAHAAKFQNFRAANIVSDYGFKALGAQSSHQSQWKKSVYEVYQDAELNWDWTPRLKEICDKAGIHYFSSPYDVAAVDMLDPYVPAYKIGSGDITWPEIISHMAKKNKPIILSTGASTLDEVCIAMENISQYNDEIILMQCNTNYTASVENFKYINLNVLNKYRELYPTVVLGLSDHTKSISTTLGAVAMGARSIEKHFTDDNHRDGPDHPFSLNPAEWREMVDRTTELVASLGDGIKRVETNELETVVLQRRSLRASRALSKGAVITAADVEALRPAPLDAYKPYELDQIIGKTLSADLPKGAHFPKKL